MQLMILGAFQSHSAYKRLKNGLSLSIGLLALIAGNASFASENPLKTNIKMTLLTGQGVDHNLKELPIKLITADIDWDNSYFSGFSLEKDYGSFASRFKAMEGSPVGTVQQGLEVVALKHHGLQDNYEIGLAYKLKSPSWNIANLKTELGLGIGLSQALSEPSYEDGPMDNPNERYRTQLLLILDSRWRLKTFPRYSVLLRVHHRSGAYGLIAPQNVGSNFLTFGVGYDF
jgi:hypothetical protein